jgi:hypothetical protein
MTSTIRRLAMLLALALGMSLAVAPSVAAHDTSDLPTTIDLPAGFRPEGIESWGKWLYAGSLADGSIYRANAKTGEGDILVPGEAGKVAVGLHIDRRGRLWVAGGPTARSASTTLVTGISSRRTSSPVRASSTTSISPATLSMPPTR